MALPLLAAAALTPLAADESGGDREGAGPRLFESDATRSFIVVCALLSLTVGVALRAVQMRDFVVRHRSQVPAYSGTESRVVILDTRHTFYGRDLVQNDPWLRDPVTMMITHGADADAAMMHAEYPRLNRVYADRFGTVWSVKP
jgi:hypothetical protein